MDEIQEGLGSSEVAHQASYFNLIQDIKYCTAEYDRPQGERYKQRLVSYTFTG